MGGLPAKPVIATLTPDVVAAHVREAVRETDGRGLLLGPDCSINPDTPEPLLQAARAARGASGSGPTAVAAARVALWLVLLVGAAPAASTWRIASSSRRAARCSGSWPSATPRSGPSPNAPRCWRRPSDSSATPSAAPGSWCWTRGPAPTGTS